MTEAPIRLMVDEWALSQAFKHCRDLKLNLTEFGIREIVGIYLAHVNHRNKDSDAPTQNRNDNE